MAYDPAPLSYASTTRLLNSTGYASAIPFLDQKRIASASEIDSTEHWGAANDYDLSSQIDPIVAVSQATGLPWAIGETGSTSERYSAADTARWAAALRAYGTQKGALLMCWWDQDTFKLDSATARAWLD